MTFEKLALYARIRAGLAFIQLGLQISNVLGGLVRRLNALLLALASWQVQQAHAQAERLISSQIQVPAEPGPAIEDVRLGELLLLGAVGAVALVTLCVLVVAVITGDV